MGCKHQLSPLYLNRLIGIPHMQWSQTCVPKDDSEPFVELDEN